MERGAGRNKGGRGAEKPGPWPPVIEPFVPKNTDHNPRELKSWARRTGFNPNLSGETSLSSLSEREIHERAGELHRGPNPREEEKPPTWNRGGREAVAIPVPVRRGGEELAGEIRRADKDQEKIRGDSDSTGRGVPAKPAVSPGVQSNGTRALSKRSPENGANNKEASPDDVEIDVLSERDELEWRLPGRSPSPLKRGLTDSPALRQWRKLIFSSYFYVFDYFFK